MTKEELKNRISMALKDPILQQGFEIICKNLTDLEKENAELKGLKDVATLIRANNDTVVTLMQLNNMLVSRTNQLTKAKELLQRFIKWARTENCEKFDVILTDAEQFLKGENIILEDAKAGNSPFDADEVFNKEKKAYPEEK